MTIVATPIVEPGTANSISAMGDLFEVLFSLAFSGNYVTGGDSFDLRGFFPNGQSTTIVMVDIMGGAGYSYEYIPAPVRQLKIYSAPGTELAAGAYPAAITGDANIVAQALGK